MTQHAATCWVRGLRPTNDLDVNDGLQIIRQAFVHPWSESLLRLRLECRNIHGILSGTSTSLPCGMLIYRHRRTWMEALCIAVLLDSSRQGVATALITELKERVVQSIGCEAINAIVPESNTTAQLFFRAMKFEQVKTFSNHFGRGLDGYLFRWVRPQQSECGESGSETARMD